MEKSQFTNFVDKFYSQAKEEKWIPIYNKQLDYFTWNKPKLSKDARLVKITNCEYFLVSPKSKIEGLAIEYLRTNFMKHNEGIENVVMPEFKKLISDQEYTVASNRLDKLDGFLQAIRADIWREMGKDKEKTTKEKITELDNLIKVAIKV